MLVDSPFTAFARTAVGGTFVAAAAIVMMVALLLWIRRPNQGNRRLVALQAATGPAFAVALNIILGGLGVWQSTLYTLPRPVLAAAALAALAGGTFAMLLLLSGYRWLARRTQHAPLLYGLALLVLFAPLIVLADTIALSERYIGFGHGFTIWMDTALGVIILALPILAFELLRRRHSSFGRS